MNVQAQSSRQPGHLMGRQGGVSPRRVLSDRDMNFSGTMARRSVFFLQQLGRHDVWTCARRKRRLVVCVQGANRCNQPFGARSCALGSPVAEGGDGDGSGIWPRSKQRVHVESTVSPGSPVWRRPLQRELCRLALHFEHIDRPCCDCGRHGRPGRPQHGQHRNLRAEARPRVPEHCGRTALVHALCRCLAHWTLSFGVLVPVERDCLSASLSGRDPLPVLRRSWMAGEDAL